jgi:hypothetical protein
MQELQERFQFFSGRNRRHLRRFEQAASLTLTWGTLNLKCGQEKKFLEQFKMLIQDFQGSML